MRARERLEYHNLAAMIPLLFQLRQALLRKLEALGHGAAVHMRPHHEDERGSLPAGAVMLLLKDLQRFLREGQRLLGLPLHEVPRGQVVKREGGGPLRGGPEDRERLLRRSDTILEHARREMRRREGVVACSLAAAVAHLLEQRQGRGRRIRGILQLHPLGMNASDGKAGARFEPCLVEFIQHPASVCRGKARLLRVSASPAELDLRQSDEHGTDGEPVVSLAKACDLVF
mmetsp:Transcript_92367/g.260932  ORF Transcript_92367/g.260932 Transcript_92367/m.260932 type:complete len:230 (-) Transcript_92367:421-1110(-)